MPNQPEVRVVIVSKLTSKSQTTIPQPIRAVLGLQPGDELAYEIVDGRVIITKGQRGTTTDDPFRTFEEMALGSGHYGLCGPLSAVT